MLRHCIVVALVVVAGLSLGSCDNTGKGGAGTRPPGDVVKPNVPGVTPPASSGAKSHSFRILTFNTALFSPIFLCPPDAYDFGATPTPFIPNCLIQNPEMGDLIGEHARQIADLVRPGFFDLVAFNEVWDEDDGKDILEEELRDTYPTFLKYVDVFGGGVEEDSGLMIFSKFAFQPLPDPGFVSEDNEGSGGDDSDRIAFVKFEECAGFDCMASKGAAMVRVRHPSSGRMLNLVASHTQADVGNEGVRLKQLRQVFGQCATGVGIPPDRIDMIHKTLGPSLLPGEGLCNWSNQQWLVLAGDLNVTGEHGLGAAVYPGTATPSNAPPEWLTVFGTPAAGGGGWSLYDAGAETTSVKDPGFTHNEERLDYAIVSRRTMNSAASIAARQGPDMCVQRVWSPPEFVGLSDHIPVAVDLNLSAEQCNPRLAYAPTAEEMGGRPDADPLQADLLQAVIRFPGNMQWWRLELPGTYAIAIDPAAEDAGVRFEIYQEDNLSLPLGSGYSLGKQAIEVCPPGAAARRRSCATVDAHKVVLPKGPYYVRVFSQDRAFNGNFWMAFHYFSCRSKEEACELKPNMPHAFQFPPAGQLLNAGDEAWFSLSVRDQADSHKAQHLAFYAENAESGAWNNPAIRVYGDDGVTELFEIDGNPISPPNARVAQSGRALIARGTRTTRNESMFMRVARTNHGADLRLYAGWRTNLTVLGGRKLGPRARLVCLDETDPENGHDEIRLEVNVDGGGWKKRGFAIYDCNNKPYPRFWDARLSIIRYLDSVRFRVVELDSGNPDNPSNPEQVSAWPLDTHIAHTVISHAHEFNFEGGRYQFHYNTGKWRN